MQNNPKPYGLIKMGKTAQPSNNLVRKPSCFDNSDDSDGDGEVVNSRFQSSNALKLAKAKINLALDEDPSIFQYDEIYHDIKKEDKPKSTVKVEKKPQYMNNLLKYAEKRKVEQEIRFERKIQKEREAEGEEFKDKESFLTSAYKSVLEERQKAQDEVEKEEMLENMFDVTKQGNMNSFYRGLYKTDNFSNKTENADTQQIVTFNNKSINRNKANIRARNLEEDIEDNELFASDINNDADVGSDKEANKLTSTDEIDTSQQNEINKVTVKEIDSFPTGQANLMSTEKPSTSAEIDETLPKKPKIDRAEYVRNIFTKRTVGDVLEQAKQRYLERKVHSIS